MSGLLTPLLVRTRPLLLGAAVAAASVGCSDDSGGPGGGSSTDADGGANDTDDDDQDPSLEWPATAEDYQFDKGTYMATFTIPPVQGGVPTCCKDFGAISKPKIQNGADQIDNAIAKLETTLKFFDQSLQTEIDSALASGSLVVLLDHHGLDGDPSDFVLVQLLGKLAAGTTYAQATNGGGEFLIDRDSFVDATGEPQNYFANARVQAGAMSAGPATLSFGLPFAGITLPFPIYSTEVAGGASSPSVTYANGTLSGYLTLDDFFGALNAYAASPACACLGLTEDLFVDSGSSWGGNCVADAAARCADPSQSVCVNLAGSSLLDGQMCGFLPSFIEGEADIDLDSDPSRYEALSVGLLWTGAAANVVGLAP